MLTNTLNLKGIAVRGSDGDLGIVDKLYFDDESWTVRYLTVETGNWQEGRKVLISADSVVRNGWQAKQIDVMLTKKQVDASPNLDTCPPVLRHHEARYLSEYEYPDYWESPRTCDAPRNAYGLGHSTRSASPLAEAERIRKELLDSHLRSTEAVAGYRLDAQDGAIGDVCGFILDDQSWTLRYIEVGTLNWWPVGKILVSPGWVERVTWPQSRVSVALMIQALKTGPPYQESEPIDREYESRLHIHYGRTPYWLNEAEAPKVFSASSGT